MWYSHNPYLAAVALPLFGLVLFLACLKLELLRRPLIAITLFGSGIALDALGYTIGTYVQLLVIAYLGYLIQADYDYFTWKR